MSATAARIAIAEALAHYCHACDDGRFDDLVGLFAADGSFAYGGRTVTGRAALLDYFTEVQAPGRRGKHLTTNTVIRVDGETATSRSDWLFLVLVDGVPTPRLTGRYDDRWVRVDGEWLLAERRVTPLA